MGYRVRVRNIDYPLNGSLSIEGGTSIKWSLPPGQWVSVEEPVYNFLKHKFGEPRMYEVPAALPDSNGNYHMPTTATRVETHQQYLVEFQKD